MLERVRKIAAIDLDDGLVYDAVTAQAIREEDEYAGVRVRLLGVLGRSRLTIGVDVNFGDPIWPDPAEIVVPRLLNIGQEPLRMLGYPLPMVVAEKVVTALERGEANTRWRDFADVLVISVSQGFRRDDLRQALETVADHRGVELSRLDESLRGMSEGATTKWAAWRRRQAQGDRLPATFTETLARVSAFIDPVLGAKEPGNAWNSQRQSWE